MEEQKLDTVYSRSTSDHQGVSQEKVNTLVHLTMALTTRICSDMVEVHI